MAALKPGDRVRFLHSLYSFKPTDTYVVVERPDQRGAHLLVWVQKVSVGQMEQPIGVRRQWVARVEEVGR